MLMVNVNGSLTIHQIDDVMLMVNGGWLMVNGWFWMISGCDKLMIVVDDVRFNMNWYVLAGWGHKLHYDTIMITINLHLILTMRVIRAYHHNRCRISLSNGSAQPQLGKKDEDLTTEERCSFWIQNPITGYLNQIRTQYHSIESIWIHVLLHQRRFQRSLLWALILSRTRGLSIQILVAGSIKHRCHPEHQDLPLCPKNL